MNAAARFPGFRLVSREQFTKWLMGTELNVHPSLANSGPYDRKEGYLSTWQVLNGSRAVVGYSTNTVFYLRNDIAMRFS